jgi:hypothetical protein
MSRTRTASIYSSRKRIPQMGKTWFISAAAVLGALALSGTAQAADTVGTITVNGTVSPKCTVTTFAATQTIGDLDDSTTGQLKSSLSALDASSTTYNSDFSLVCNGSNAGVSVTATSLTTSGAAPTGYANAVGFTGRAAFKLINASDNALSTKNYDATSAVGGGTANASALGAGKFLQNTSNNLRVSTFGFTSAASAVLIAGSYTGSVVVTITPN